MVAHGAAAFQIMNLSQIIIQVMRRVVVPRKGGTVVMLHCHMMNHEEQGMMQAVEVYKD